MALVKIEKENFVGKVILNNPEKLNVLSLDMLRELYEAMKDMEEDSSIRVVILTGEGKAFAAGADIKEMSKMTPLEAMKFSRFGQEVLDHIENMAKPVIAAINGYALGGGLELAMACDIRIASQKAKMGQPEVKLGLIPGFAGTQRLLRIVGQANAKYLVLTGMQIDSETALRMGIVQEVVEHERLMKRTMEVARMILDAGETALRLAKAIINMGRDAAFRSAEVHEGDAFSLLFSTEETHEGLLAFLEKRKPGWAKG